MSNSPSIAIVGGGPGGLMLARLLQLRGLDPVVFERDAHAGERPQGGSLDLHDDTGQQAMRLAGLEREFTAAARPEDQGDRLYDQHGTLLYDIDGAGFDRPEIDRTALRRLLLDSLTPGTVRWNSRIATIAANPGGGFDVTGEETSERFDIVIGADGAWSRVRPLVSDAEPAYEGVALMELDFRIDRDPAVAALTGNGKMFAPGDNRLIVTQKNGQGHIRTYVGMRMPEATAQALTALAPDAVRAEFRTAFAGWAPDLARVIDGGDFVATRALYALPTGHRWTSRPGVTLLGDAAHLMSPFSGEGVNQALADAADLADALTSGEGWAAVTAYEDRMAMRAARAARGAAQGLAIAFSPGGAAPILEHYRARTAGHG